MSSKIKIGMIAIMLIAVSGAFAASAFTSGSVERSANVDVVTDDVGLIALQDGTSGNIVSMNTSGSLAIDFGQSDAQGVNANAHYEIGDPTSANTTYAFNLTNLDDESHTFSLDYTGSDSEDADANIEFRVYNSNGVEQTIVSEESGAVSLNDVAPGETHYVVIVVDTHGLTDATNLSGTLKISA